MLDFSSNMGIIKNEERTTHAVAPQVSGIRCGLSRAQPSLGRVAVVLFALRFPDDDTHRILSNVKSKSHCTSPPFGRMERSATSIGASPLHADIACFG